jgi:quinol-cytochrome oxidoreductase complex cytochrome b subunit
VYLHIGRGLYYGSYRAPRTLVWVLGTIIFILMIVTAFLGYLCSPKWLKFNNKLYLNNINKTNQREFVTTILESGFINKTFVKKLYLKIEYFACLIFLILLILISLLYNEIIYENSFKVSEKTFEKLDKIEVDNIEIGNSIRYDSFNQNDEYSDNE